MQRPTNRAPVRRHGAQSYLLLSLVSFAGSVMLTRLFLELTGYPQLGGGELHIAHVLWGGLILFVAALLPLIFANSWALQAAALLSGIGVGLFIDEVGKFITQNNDYFCPPAAPIIYALFLLTVLVYLRVRKPPAWNARTELYSILDNFGEVLDHDLERDERDEMQQRIQRIIAHSPEPEFVHLAQALSDYLRRENIHMIPPRPTHMEKLKSLGRQVEQRFFHRQRIRLALVFAFVLVAALAILDILNRFLPAGQVFNLESILLANMLRGEVRSQAGANWFLVHTALQVIISLLALSSAILILSGREKRGLELATICLVLALTMVNLLAFFIDQFSATLTALVHFSVFLVLTHYRRRYFHTLLSL